MKTILSILSGIFVAFIAIYVYKKYKEKKEIKSSNTGPTPVSKPFVGHLVASPGGLAKGPAPAPSPRGPAPAPSSLHRPAPGPSPHDHPPGTNLVQTLNDPVENWEKVGSVLNNGTKVGNIQKALMEHEEFWQGNIDPEQKLGAETNKITYHQQLIILATITVFSKQGQTSTGPFPAHHEGIENNLTQKDLDNIEELFLNNK